MLRFGLSFPNTASNFARSTDSTPSLIFLVLRKNIAEKCAGVRAESPEYGVKFRLKYACTSALIFLVLRKSITENDLRFRAEFPVKLRFLRLAVCIYGGEVFAARKCAESPNIICK